MLAGSRSNWVLDAEFGCQFDAAGSGADAGASGAARLLGEPGSPLVSVDRDAVQFDVRALFHLVLAEQSLVRVPGLRAGGGGAGAVGASGGEGVLFHGRGAVHAPAGARHPGADAG